MGEGAGKLLVVGTPIGNLADASPRVIEALSGADAILCEDTRVTSKLLSRYGIRTSLERADENVLRNRIPQILERLEAGEELALVSDAGMPAISDPGQALVDAALDAGCAVSVIPGPSAVTCALALSGLDSTRFMFAGFLPRKAGALARELEELAGVPATIVLYESPHRAAATLQAIAAAFPGRRVALVRELTKVHEEVVRGEASQLAAEIASREELRGECAIVVEGPRGGEGREATACDPAELDDTIRAGLSQGEPKSALAKRLSAAFAQTRQEIYDRILELSHS